MPVCHLGNTHDVISDQGIHLTAHKQLACWEGLLSYSTSWIFVLQDAVYHRPISDLCLPIARINNSMCQGVEEKLLSL